MISRALKVGPERNNAMKSEKKMLVAPSILSADFRNLEKEVKAVESAGADMIHCDIMDGHFVPNITIGPFIIEAVKKCVSIPLDVHLMISNPEKYIDTFRNAGADIITVHAEVCNDLPKILNDIKKGGAKAGVTVNPDIPVDSFIPYLQNIDQVLIMSVYAGFPGQIFIQETMNKVKIIFEKSKKSGYNLDIEVDGGINGETAFICGQSGANVLVAGSYIYGGSDYRERIEAVRRGAMAGMSG